MPTNSAHIAVEETGRGGEERDKPPLSSLSNPAQQVSRGYKKSELQKHCTQLGLGEKEKEIEELKTKLYFAEETIKHLKESLQQQNRSRSRQTLASTSNEGNILLIGDSCIKEVKSSDLNNKAMIRTLPEANLDLLKSWIREKLEISLKECIIYCGTQDLLDEDVALERVLDNLGAIVAELKEKNNDIVVKVCELVPALEARHDLNSKINQYNYMSAPVVTREVTRPPAPWISDTIKETIMVRDNVKKKLKNQRENTQLRETHKELKKKGEKILRCRFRVFSVKAKTVDLCTRRDRVVFSSGTTSVVDPMPEGTTRCLATCGPLLPLSH
ncbi:uncharacterized protein [Palaemon carinicauda]|uniref:uncharacterized protein n=1 Tax=Palaemon carinicauda TaxID=392227 RepID=UPI0035B5CD41